MGFTRLLRCGFSKKYGRGLVGKIPGAHVGLICLQLLLDLIKIRVHDLDNQSDHDSGTRRSIVAA